MRKKIFKSLALTALGLCQCGYKAPPSPYFDEKERFSDEIYERSQELEAAQKQKTPSVFFPSDKQPKRMDKSYKDGASVPKQQGTEK